MKRRLFSDGGRKGPPFNVASVLTFGLLALVVVVIVTVVTRIKEILKAIGDKGIIGALLKALGVDIEGGSDASNKGYDNVTNKLKESLAKNKISILPRHNDYAEHLRGLFQEARFLVTIFDKHVTNFRAAEIGDYLITIAQNVVPRSRWKYDADGFKLDPVDADTIEREFAAVYAAYDVSELANREAPILALFVSTTKGTLLGHIMRYLPKTFWINNSGYDHALEYTRDDCAAWFVHNRYINDDK